MKDTEFRAVQIRRHGSQSLCPFDLEVLSHVLHFGKRK